MVNVQLAGRTRGQKCIVQTWAPLASIGGLQRKKKKITISSCQVLPNGIRPRERPVPLGGIVRSGELADFEVKREILFAMRISQKLPEQQSHRCVVDDQVQAMVVRIPRLVSPILPHFAPFRRFSPRVIAARGVFACEPSGNSLAPLGQLVDGVLGGLEPDRTRILPNIGSILFGRLDQIEVDEQPGHLVDFSSIDRRAAVHQPIHRRFPGESILYHPIRQFPLLCDFHADHAVIVIAERVRIRRGDAILDVGPLLTDKAPENDFDRRPIVRELVRHPVSFQDDELHRVA